jgi:hypothetical protein
MRVKADCEACAGIDLLFARALDSGRIFFVCGGCAAAGAEIDDCDTCVSIRDLHTVLAPHGWTLASRDEVEAAGLSHLVIDDNPDDDYVNLISWYPGFQFPSPDVS